MLNRRRLYIENYIKTFFLFKRITMNLHSVSERQRESCFVYLILCPRQKTGYFLLYHSINCNWKLSNQSTKDHFLQHNMRHPIQIANTTISAAHCLLTWYVCKNTEASVFFEMEVLALK